MHADLLDERACALIKCYALREEVVAKPIEIQTAIKSIEFTHLQLHLLTVLVCAYCEDTKDLEPINNLYRAVGSGGYFEKRDVSDWVSRFTPLRYNAKKKRFTASQLVSGWHIAQGLRQTHLIESEKLSVHLAKLAVTPEPEAIHQALEKVEKQLENIQVELYKLRAAGKLTNIDSFEMTTDDEKTQIKAYLAAHPASDPIGKFGVPQSKYRYGSFGLSSMDMIWWNR
ncbi:hypothetical protein C8D85_1594 [Marinomonas communis]|uniref:Uncharacterized protein n=1 Tax=Marinomonas communis TaxID=28254 RepID=A0A4V3DGE0_9GAMM|nr:hypothetical protein C8D85_1594 [Marinomonas communis]